MDSKAVKYEETAPETLAAATSVPPRPMLFMDAWKMLMGAAIFARTAAMACQFRGHPPRGLGARAGARSRGFSNVRHEAAVLWERQKHEAAAAC